MNEPTKYIGEKETECFYCSLPIEFGQEVFENQGSYCHRECIENGPDDEDVDVDIDDEADGELGEPDGGDDE